ncbi:sphingomyelin phosphodiesterase [Bacillus thuringiensis]|uniref:sphingomyelin phosphodiesterase n=1 Tax=Bacillus thuringiensis TaxID=1428 RepID=UPI003EE387FC
MINTTLSLRNLVEHLGYTSQNFGSFRKLLGRPSGSLKVSVRFAPFSIMTQNMALLVLPAEYRGTNRKGAIREIVNQIRTLSPDIVGLCEVFSNSERKNIRNALKDMYPYFREGPDEQDYESDGGLLLLSKHSILAANQMIFRVCDGFDCFANKGVIHIRIHPTFWPRPLDIFFSHAQDISTRKGVNKLYSQLDAINNFISSCGQPDVPKIIMGDLNIPADNPQHYFQLLKRLEKPVDCWTLAGNPSVSGQTFTIDNNFYGDDDDRPSNNQRLDYILMKANNHLVPILNDIKILKIKHKDRYISDHFGVYALFNKLAIITYN